MVLGEHHEDMLTDHRKDIDEFLEEMIRAEAYRV